MLDHPAESPEPVARFSRSIITAPGSNAHPAARQQSLLTNSTYCVIVLMYLTRRGETRPTHVRAFPK